MRPQINRSLSVHLRETEDHSRFPFHPACPVCRRDRLAGSLESDELLSRRTQAAIAAGLLAFSTGGATAAAASPPDEVIEGTAEVVEGGDDDASVDLELEGEELKLPDEVPTVPEAPAPAAGVDEDSGPLEPEPATDVREPVVSVTGETVEPVAQEAPAPEPTAATPAPVVPPEAPDVPEASAPQEPQVKVGPAPEGGERRVARAGEAAEDSKQPGSSSAPPAPVAEPAADATVEPAPDVEATPAVERTPAAAPVTTRVVARTTTGRVGRGDRFHVVRAGESLWSIAADLLGERATVPRIAREVNRLWELNDELIGTGRPDLLFAGTRLRLR